MAFSVPTNAVATGRTLLFNRIGRTPLLLFLVWTVLLWWGERTVFEQSADLCQWEKWESWPSEAQPHHVLLVADPQIVDPHTYPGRPWLLNELTILYTDLYLRRVYQALLRHTQPHTTVFLGDLFDGGREWATAKYKSPIESYQKYGTKFWLSEYRRFMDLFVEGWYGQDLRQTPSNEGRRLILSLPGNHDLGFANGINPHVKSRFDAHFGPLNRVDMLGNHTFVSVDTVSLSGMDQVDPATGSFGHGDGSGPDETYASIWKPVESFLANAKHLRNKAVDRYSRQLDSLTRSDTIPLDSKRLDPRVVNLPRGTANTKSKSQIKPSISSSNFPTVLLSHVPLYRNQDVTCGPDREHGTAITLGAGYQYQNVLTPSVTSTIMDHLDASQVVQIYSGDDHDYCEIEHGEYTGRIREITVKSISWAMGVRKPGVQLASLWNPIDLHAIPQGNLDASTPKDTIQNHLCLLPDQLAIFIRYGLFLALTIIILFARAATYDAQKAQLAIHHQLSSSSPTSLLSPAEQDKSQPLLPLARKRTPPLPPPPISTSPTKLERTNSSTSTTPTTNKTTRSRTSSRSQNTYQPPLVSHATNSTSSSSFYPHTSNNNINHDLYDDEDDWGMPTTTTRKRKAYSTPYPRIFTHSLPRTLLNRLFTPASTKAGELVRSLYLVGIPGFLVYSWLFWSG